jgi:hypothetical protein
MEEHRRLAIESTCARLAVDFCRHSDARAYDEYVALFTERALFVRASERLEGAVAIGATLRSRPANWVVRHLCANTIVDVLDGERASGRGILLVVRHDTATSLTAPPVVADFADLYVRTSEGWRISERTVSLPF